MRLGLTPAKNVEAIRTISSSQLIVGGSGRRGVVSPCCRAAAIDKTDVKLFTAFWQNVVNTARSVQPLVRIPGRVRQSRAKVTAGLENRHCHGKVRIDCSLKCEGNAAEAATDDDHPILLCR